MAKAILVVDDEKPLSLAMSLKLRKVGYEVDVANDGNQAIQQIKSKKYDLVLLDLIMPNVGGFEVLEKMAHLDAKPPVIVMSNLSQEEDMKKAQLYGIEDYVVKANSALAQIVERINQFFAK